jgi:hypothetical protein
MASILQTLLGTGSKDPQKAQELYDKFFTDYGFKTQNVGGEKLAPVTGKMRQTTGKVNQEGVAQSKGYSEEYVEKFAGEDNPATGGNKNALLQEARMASESADPDSQRAKDMVEQVKATVDQSLVGGATPVQYDPRIVDIQRSRATIVTRVPHVGQAGFNASYSTVDSRDDPIGFVSESESWNPDQFNYSAHSLSNEQKAMKIHMDVMNLSDFTVAAEDSLGYMDVEQMTLGQRVIAHQLQKAQAIFYGDPSVGAGDQSVEDGDAYEGLAKMANDAGNNVDKSSFTKSGDQPYLEDIKSELTNAVENSGLTYDTAEISVSPTMFDRLENELGVQTRTNTYDGDVNYGGRQLSIKGAPVVECPNIRGFTQSSTNFTPSETDVFIWDRMNVQFRQLMPLSVIPLAKDGLSEDTALAEFGTLISKSKGNHVFYLSSYA